MKQIIPTNFTIETARCILRCLSEDDIPHIFAATRFVGFNDGMLWEAPANIDELYKPLQNNLLAWEAGSVLPLQLLLIIPRFFLGVLA